MKMTTRAARRASLLGGDGGGSDPHADQETAHCLGAEVRQKRMLANAGHVFGPVVLNQRVEPLGLGDASGVYEALSELLGRVLHRPGVQRDDDVLAPQQVPQLHSLSLSSGTTSAGRRMTGMPARSSAAIFSAAVPPDPDAMAPACPIRRPGGAVWPAMNPTTGLVMERCTNSAACCSSVPPISPIITTASVPASAWKAARQATNDVPMIGSPPIPTHVDWPKPWVES